MRLLRVPTLLLLIALGVSLGGLSLYNWLWGPDAHLRAARQALEQRDFTAAQRHAALYLKERPQGAEGHLLAAQAIRRQLSPRLPCGLEMETAAPTIPSVTYEEAEQHLHEFERCGGLAEVARLERYLMAAQQGDLAHVAGGLRFLVEQNHPDSVMILESLVKGYLLTYRLPEAAECLDRWLARREDLQALLWRGWVSERRADSGNALRAYCRAVELDAGNVEARARLAELLMETSQPRAAIAHWEHLRAEHPDDSSVLLGLARCRRALGQTEAARRLLDDLLAHHPLHVAALIESGRLALDEQRVEEAEGLLRRAVQQAPSSKQALYAFTQCLTRCGKTDESKMYGERLDRVRADFQRLDEVLQRVQADPRDPAPRCEAGLIYLRNNHDQEGLRWLTSALREDSQHGPTHQALADYFRRRGDSERAAYHRQRAAQGRTP